MNSTWRADWVDFCESVLCHCLTLFDAISRSKVLPLIQEQQKQKTSCLGLETLLVVTCDFANNAFPVPRMLNTL